MCDVDRERDLDVLFEERRIYLDGMRDQYRQFDKLVAYVSAGTLVILAQFLAEAKLPDPLIGRGFLYAGVGLLILAILLTCVGFVVSAEASNRGAMAMDARINRRRRRGSEIRVLECKAETEHWFWWVWVLIRATLLSFILGLVALVIFVITNLT